MFGIRVGNLRLYEQALQHKSLESESGKRQHNERLEYLGDAILSAVVADYLVKEYPDHDEGFLTMMRAKIVSRETLNKVAVQLGVKEQLQVSQRLVATNESIYGNAFEALIGALYLDKGYRKASLAIQQRILGEIIDVAALETYEHDPKSKVFQWAQRSRADLEFRITDMVEHGSHRSYTAEVLIDGKVMGTGKGSSKKKAEQEASSECLGKLNDH